MGNTKDPILRILETVKEDSLSYRSKVKEFLDGQTSPIAFRAYRVPMGVYEQRTTGKFMVRFSNTAEILSKITVTTYDCTANRDTQIKPSKTEGE